MSAKRHEKLLSAVTYPGLTTCKRFGDSGRVDVGIMGWGSTFGEILEAMQAAQAEGIRCSALKVVMLSPLPITPITAFFDDCASVLVPEVNYEGQLAHLVAGAIGRPVVRLNRVTGAPMVVAEILAEIRRLAGVTTAGTPAAATQGA